MTKIARIQLAFVLGIWVGYVSKLICDIIAQGYGI
jgi:hypothetical protein